MKPTVQPARQKRRRGSLYSNLVSAEVAVGRQLSLGRCLNLCSTLKDRAPVCMGWVGTEPASSKSCPVCGDPLKRMSSHNWDAAVWLLDGRIQAKGGPR